MIKGEAFEKFLNKKGIKIDENLVNNIDSNQLSDEMLEKQLKIISKFHKKASGYNGMFKDRLDSDVGKIVEEAKVSIKKFKRELNRISKNGIENDVDKVLLEHGKLYMDRGEKIIDNIYKNKYYDLIIRSMNNKEICLGNVDFKYLSEDHHINIKTTDKCKYNMVEVDAVNLLYRYKKKGVDLNYKDLAKKFCYMENLGGNSYKFIISLISFPYEFMKECKRYRYRKGELRDDEYSKRILKAMEQDKVFLV